MKVRDNNKKRKTRGHKPKATTEKSPAHEQHRVSRKKKNSAVSSDPLDGIGKLIIDALWLRVKNAQLMVKKNKIQWEAEYDAAWNKGRAKGLHYTNPKLKEDQHRQQEVAKLVLRLRDCIRSPIGKMYEAEGLFPEDEIHRRLNARAKKHGLRHVSKALMRKRLKKVPKTKEAGNQPSYYPLGSAMIGFPDYFPELSRTVALPLGAILKSHTYPALGAVLNLPKPDCNVPVSSKQLQMLCAASKDPKQRGAVVRAFEMGIASTTTRPWQSPVGRLLPIMAKVMERAKRDPAFKQELQSLSRAKLIWTFKKGVVVGMSKVNPDSKTP